MRTLIESIGKVECGRCAAWQPLTDELTKCAPQFEDFGLCLRCAPQSVAVCLTGDTELRAERDTIPFYVFRRPATHKDHGCFEGVRENTCESPWEHEYLSKYREECCKVREENRLLRKHKKVLNQKVRELLASAKSDVKAGAEAVKA